MSFIILQTWEVAVLSVLTRDGASDVDFITEQVLGPSTCKGLFSDTSIDPTFLHIRGTCAR